jgi:NADPH:quinone reductase-like Zn-dependent oxidoreductase
VVGEALHLEPHETLLVHGADTAAGALMVQLADLRGARVFAVADRRHVEGQRDSLYASLYSAGAETVLDAADPEWPQHVARLTAGAGVTAAAIAQPRDPGTVPAAVMSSVASGGRLATVADPPPEPVRGITVAHVRPRPDDAQLDELAELLSISLLDFHVSGAILDEPCVLAG